MDNSAEIVLATIRAVEERDAERLLALYHDDVEFVEAPSLPYGGIVRGKAAQRERILRPSATSWAGICRCSRRPPSAGWIPASSPATAARSPSCTASAR
jgi:hypothetical protein